MKRYDDVYELSVDVVSEKGLKASDKLSGSVAKWFDEKGYFLYDNFEGELKKLYNRLNQNKKLNWVVGL